MRSWIALAVTLAVVPFLPPAPAGAVISVESCTATPSDPTCDFVCQPGQRVSVHVHDGGGTFPTSSSTGSVDCAEISASCEASDGFDCMAASFWYTLTGGIAHCGLSGTTKPTTTATCSAFFAGCDEWFVIDDPVNGKRYYLTTRKDVWEESNGRDHLQCSAGCDPDDPEDCWIADTLLVSIT